ncbi:T9SS type B sorting domain-containing protein [Mucilaginibacter corticis]|uniref:T9SS type B sorting domain-containing protein n=1 Tax=Mucilaginibacter corticis TaxID=2597670 RepID=A0A556MG68_9SPHI|nr:MBG domain-containing protein [Mucilaginibacter corticis]TSJ38893.1 T9SS type B sorting domain-containing protein [Mucilaginibacter corticis]
MKSYLFRISCLILLCYFSVNVLGQTRRQVNAVAPEIFAGLVTGSIATCPGSPSSSPDIQQFVVVGNSLTDPVTIAAPTGFEVSLTPGADYVSRLIFQPVGGLTSSTTIYVRAAAATTPGNISGNVSVSSPGAAALMIAVKGTINAIPVVNGAANQVVVAGQATASVNFTGTGNAYNWTNDQPGIGLPASGSGNIAAFTAQNTTNVPIVATLRVTPTNTGYAYIPNSGDGTVSVIDPNTNSVIKSILVGANPSAIAVSPDSKYIYVANSGSNSVSVISTVTNKVVSTIPVGNGPDGVAVSPDGTSLYVVNAFDNILSEIKLSNNTFPGNIPVGAFPSAVLVSPDGEKIYTTSGINKTVSVYIPAQGTIAATIRVGGGATGMATSPDGTHLYVTNQNDGTVSVINTVTYLVEKTIPVGSGPNSGPLGIVISPDGSKAYVTNQSDKTVSVINMVTGIVTTTIPVGANPTGLSLNPDGSLVYVSNSADKTISVINTTTNQVTATIYVGNSPNGLGNYFTRGTGCSGMPVQFTITVNPVGTTTAKLTSGPVTGNITACDGIPSASPNLQQFDVSGQDLTGDITIKAPAGFEISTTATANFTTQLTLTPINGVVNTTVVYVRSAAAAAGTPAGNVVISTPGVQDLSVAVTATIHALPIADAIADQTLNNGDAVAAINFTGTADVFSWVNDTPAIGLAAYGSGNITSFTAVNNGSTPVIAHITVTPSSAGTACEGTPVEFTITVNPLAIPVISPAGTIASMTSIYGSASSSGQFDVSGTNMTDGILVTPSAGFEVSTDNVHFGGSVTIGAAGTIYPATVYVRLVTTANAGTHTGSLLLSSVGAKDVSVPITASIVDKATLTITANDKNKPYGETLNDGIVNSDYTASGLQNGETVGSVTMSYEPGGAPGANAGTYQSSVTPSAATGGTFDPANYTISYTSGKLVVTPVMLSVIADDQTKAAGDPNPELTITYIGFVNNEGPANLSAQPIATTPAVTNSPPGTYPIDVDGALSDNYTISYTDGTLTVTRPVIRISNAFTPNGDGINDLWEISSLNIYPQCLVCIYNRYGNLIYRSEAYAKPWDGTYKDQQLPTGTYYYVIDLKDGTKPLAGPLTLIR